MPQPRRDNNYLLYNKTKKFIANLLPRDHAAATLVVYPEVSFKADHSKWEYVPKIIRIALLVFVVFGLWTLVPHFGRALRALDEIPKLRDSLQENNKRLAELIAEKQAASLSPTVAYADRRAAMINAQKLIEPAIADLSRRNDDQSQRAFEALGRGDTSQAESLFQNIASDEEKAGNKAAAARALRHLAAFNRLTNVAKATSLFSQAAKLQPDDYNNWLDLGRAATSAGRFELAETAFKNAVALAKRNSQANPNGSYWRRELYASQTDLGNVFRYQDKWAEAASMYDAASLIAVSLVQEAPDNLQFKRDLSVALEKKGHVLNKNHDYQGALVAYQRSLDLAKSLAMPDDVGSQRDLAIALWEVANTQNELGKSDLAQQYYNESIRILSAVVDADPKHPEYQTALIGLYVNVATFAEKHGTQTEARGYYQKALSIAKSLVNSDSSNYQFLRQLTNLEGQYGDFLRNEGKIDDALSYFREQIATTTRLLADGPNEDYLRENLSVTFYNVGEIYRCKGNKTAALENYAASVSIVGNIDVSHNALARDNLDFSRSRIVLINSGQFASCAGYVEK